MILDVDLFPVSSSFLMYEMGINGSPSNFWFSQRLSQRVPVKVCITQCLALGMPLTNSCAHLPPYEREAQVPPQGLPDLVLVLGPLSVETTAC